MSRCEHFFDILFDILELHGLSYMIPTHGDELWHEARLSELQECIEDDELTFRESMFRELFGDLGSVGRLEIIVEPLLFTSHLEVDDLFLLCGEILQDEFFCPPEDKWPHLSRELDEIRDISLHVAITETGFMTEKSWHQKLENAQKFEEIILDGCSTEGKSIGTRECRDRFGTFTFTIFYILCFIEDDIVPCESAECFLIDEIHEESIRYDDNLCIFRDIAHPSFPIFDIGASQVGDEFHSFIDPVQDERSGNDDEAGCETRFSLWRFLILTLEKYQRLDRLPEPHIVSEDATEMVCVEEVEPLITLLLVLTEGDGGTFRDFLFGDSLEVREGTLKLLYFFWKFEHRETFLRGLQESDIILADLDSGFDIFLIDPELIPFRESLSYILSESHHGSIVEGDVFSSFP